MKQQILSQLKLHFSKKKRNKTMKPNVTFRLNQIITSIYFHLLVVAQNNRTKEFYHCIRNNFVPKL